MSLRGSDFDKVGVLGPKGCAVVFVEDGDVCLLVGGFRGDLARITPDQADHLAGLLVKNAVEARSATATTSEPA